MAKKKNELIVPNPNKTNVTLIDNPDKNSVAHIFNPETALVLPCNLSGNGSIHCTVKDGQVFFVDGANFDLLLSVSVDKWRNFWQLLVECAIGSKKKKMYAFDSIIDMERNSRLVVEIRTDTHKKMPSWKALEVYLALEKLEFSVPFRQLQQMTDTIPAVE